MDRPLELVQLTDLHLSETVGTLIQGVDADAGFEAVIAQLRQQPGPDAVLLTGDLSHDGSRASYERVVERIGEIDARRVMALPGNHDDPATLRTVLGNAGFEVGPEARLGSWLIVLLDSCVPGAVSGRLAPTVLDGLRRTLARHSAQHALVCLHHQPVDVGTPWLDLLGLQHPEDLFDVLDRHGWVRGVVFGHIHAAHRCERRGLPLLGGPATSCQFQPGAAEVRIADRPPGYRRISLSPDGSIDSRVEYVGSPA